jgi:hypothetical protein
MPLLRKSSANETLKRHPATQIHNLCGGSLGVMRTICEGGLRSADTHDSFTAHPLQARSVVVRMELHGNGNKEELNETLS